MKRPASDLIHFGEKALQRVGCLRTEVTLLPDKWQTSCKTGYRTRLTDLHFFKLKCMK